MLTRKLFSTLLAVVSITSTSAAQLVPGPGSGGSGGNQNQPNPPRYQDGCNNAYGPCEPGRPSRPDRPNPPRYPDYPDYPNHPPQRPDYPHYPDYPNYPDYPPHRPDYPPQYPDYPNHPGYEQREVKTGWVGRSVRNERLSLAQIVGLDYHSQGWEIEVVRARTRPNSASTTIARLVVDGRIVAMQTNPGYEIGLYPQRTTVIGNVHGVQLEIVGSTEIQEVEVQLVRRDGGHYPPQPPPISGDGQIDIPLYESVYGNDQIDLNPYVDYYRYNGYRIEQIVVQARSSYGTGTVDFLINGFNMGSMRFRDGGYSSQESLYISQRPVIGRDAGSLVLRTRGNLTIEHVAIQVSRY